MATETTYQQLQAEKRMKIDCLMDEGWSLRAIARKLQRAPSTISRELSRNTQDNGLYRSRVAQASRHSRRQSARPTALQLALNAILWNVVCNLLHEQQWFPQEIAATLKRTFPDEPSRHVFHETIYNALYAQPRGELRRRTACLHQHRSKHLPRSRGTDRRGGIPDMVSIHVRPPEINDRLMLGHWEGDLIKGADNRSSVAVLVERMSRTVLLARMFDVTAASALTAFTTKLQSLVAPLRQTGTYDQSR